MLVQVCMSNIRLKLLNNQILGETKKNNYFKKSNKTKLESNYIYQLTPRS
jgi:hypothetical protein